jgi:hypothetical protein
LLVVKRSIKRQLHNFEKNAGGFFKMREEKSMREICGESDQMREPPAGCERVGNYVVEIYKLQFTRTGAAF